MTRHTIAALLLLVPSGATSSSSTPSTCETLAVCREECGAKDAASCVRLGDLLFETPEGVDHPTEGIAAYTSACGLDLPRGCAKLGLKLYTYHPQDAAVVARTADLWTRACGRGEVNACGNLAVFYRDGIGVQRDAKRADALFDAACTGGSALACVQGSAQGATGEVQAGLMIADAQRCETGSGDACARLAAEYGAAQDTRRATALRHMACLAGRTDLCE